MEKIMSGTEYPKIDTLYDRDGSHHVIVGKLRRPEFGNIKMWYVTEKLNGRNTRVSLVNNGADGIVDYGGKTDEADMPPELLEYLKETFTLEKMKAAFWMNPLKIPQRVTIYGEGYGHESCAAGSKMYRDNISFRLFDCLVDTWWLKRNDLENVAMKLKIKCVPLLGIINDLPKSLLDLENIIKISHVATEENNNFCAMAEGIVAFTDPYLFNRKGERVMWKLKVKDFIRQELIKFKWMREKIGDSVEWKLVRKGKDDEIIGSIKVTKGSPIAVGTKKETCMLKLVAECNKLGYNETQENDEKTIKLMVINIKNLILGEIEKLYVGD
jgi:hypothetical protein